MRLYRGNKHFSDGTTKCPIYIKSSAEHYENDEMVIYSACPQCKEKERQSALREEG